MRNSLRSTAARCTLQPASDLLIRVTLHLPNRHRAEFLVAQTIEQLPKLFSHLSGKLRGRFLADDLTQTDHSSAIIILHIAATFLPALVAHQVDCLMACDDHQQTPKVVPISQLGETTCCKTTTKTLKSAESYIFFIGGPANPGGQPLAHRSVRVVGSISPRVPAPQIDRRGENPRSNASPNRRNPSAQPPVQSIPQSAGDNKGHYSRLGWGPLRGWQTDLPGPRRKAYFQSNLSAFRHTGGQNPVACVGCQRRTGMMLLKHHRVSLVANENRAALPFLGAKWIGDRAGVPPLGGIATEIPPKGGTPAAVLRRSHLRPEEPNRADQRHKLAPAAAAAARVWPAAVPHPNQECALEA